MPHRSKQNFPASRLVDPAAHYGDPIDSQQLTALVLDIEEAIRVAAELHRRWENQALALADTLPVASLKLAHVHSGSEELEQRVPSSQRTDS